ncbi:MAG: SIMPL domain-containing protein [Ignavibacteriae bacterium]|nr:SIMPL domain-containing protein [Ignavibacteriota bacterium]MCB9215245.1 SIMPL domain-containing protein [Ignavibacteria bacterium]
MIRILALLLTTSLISSYPLLAQYEEGSEEWRVLFSEGEADTLVKPDEIVFFLSIETSHLDIDSAQAEYEKKMEKLTELTKKMKIKEEDIRMDLLDIEPENLLHGSDGTDFNPRAFSSSSDEPELKKYYVMRSITLTLRDQSKYTSFLSGLLRLGIEMRRSPLYRVSNSDAIRDTLSLRAIRNARQRAETLAHELGMKVADPIRVGQADWYDASSYSSYSPYNNSYGGYSNPEGQRSLLTPDRISFSLSVSVTFQIVPE